MHMFITLKIALTLEVYTIMRYINPHFTYLLTLWANERILYTSR